MHAALPRRSVSPGQELELLVLALAGGEILGIDLGSGAFARVPDPGGAPLRPFDVVVARVADGEPLWSPHAPELVETTGEPIEAVARVPAKRAERWLRPLLDPRPADLLGFRGPSVPFWTLRGERPSMALLQPSAGPVVRPAPSGYRCRFSWRGVEHDLPLFDSRLLGLLEERGAWRCSGEALAHLLGYRPQRVLVSLSPPFHGHCYKVAAGLLPR